MRMLCTSDLHDGMITGLDIKLNNKVIVPRGAVLTNDMIIHLSSLLEAEKKVWVCDLYELKPMLLKNSQLTRSYIDFLVSSFRSIFDIDLTDERAYNKLINIMNKYFYTNRQLLYETIVLRDNHCYTYEHSLNVTLYALIIGLNEGLTSKELQILVLGCLLHDLGKCNINNTILDKPGKLSDSEFKAIKQHPIYGVELADSLSCADDRIKGIILQHHEKLDGTGYPYGLSYEKINHLSRVATVADIFDAVTSKRAYHQKRSVRDGIIILDGDSSRGKISKEEVNMLVQSLILYPQNTIVVLNNDKSGVVLEDCNSRSPKVLCYDGTVLDLSVRKDLEVVKAL